MVGVLARGPGCCGTAQDLGFLGSSPRPPTRARQASGPENGDAAWHQFQRIDVHSCTPLAHKAKMWKLERATPDMGDDMEPGAAKPTALLHEKRRRGGGCYLT